MQLLLLIATFLMHLHFLLFKTVNVLAPSNCWMLAAIGSKALSPAFSENRGWLVMWLLWWFVSRRTWLPWLFKSKMDDVSKQS